MTREDAIRHIECVTKNAIEGGYDSAFCSAKALILVAEALKAETCDRLKLDGMLEDAYEHGYQQARYDYETQPCEDAVKREAVLNTLDTMDKALDENRTVEAYKELLKECYKELPPVTPKPLDSVLGEIRAEIPKLTCGDNEYRQALVKVADVIKCIDKHRKGESE